MTQRRRIRWDRMALVTIPLFVILLLIFTQCGKDSGSEESSSAGESSAPTTSVADDVPVTNADPFIVVIDAGHGGYDGGSTADGVTRLEKDDNLRLALLTEEKLKAYEGVTVLMRANSRA